MNQNRGRNIFTLGDFHLSKRSSSASRRPQGNTNDIFERDPFKIQSYNFRYAERPVYPVRPTSRQQESGRNSVNAKPADTFYYNPDFTNVNNNNSRDLRVNPFGNDPQHTRFQQQRRRRYVQGNVSTSGNLLGSQNSYPSTMASSREFHTHGQPVSNLPQLKTSFADNILEYDRSSSSAAPSFIKDSLSQVCQGPSALKRSRTENGLKTSTNRGHVLGSSIVDMCEGVGNTSGSRNYLRNTETSIGNRCNNSAAFSFSNSSKRPFYDLNPSTMAMCSFTSQVKAFPSGNPLKFPLASDIKGHKSLYSSSRGGSSAKRKRSSSTGCEININIKNLEDNSITDNLTIKIENDPAEQSSNGPTANKLHIKNDLSASPSCQTPNIKLNINTSSSSFVIDKKLSKFSNPSGTQPTIEIKTNHNPRISTVNLKPDNLTNSTPCANRLSSWDRKLNNAKSQGESYEWLTQNQSERARQRSLALNAIYSPQLKNMAMRKSTMPSSKASTERMPSMLPWRDHLSLSRKSTAENLNKNSYSYSSNLNYSKSQLKSANISRTKSPSKSPSKSSTKPDVMVSTSPSKTFKVNTSPLSCCCNSKLSLKRLILHKFHSSKQSLTLRSQQQLLNDAALPTMLMKGKRCSATAEQRRLNKFKLTKLPLKININVFAEKVKMFRRV